MLKEGDISTLSLRNFGELFKGTPLTILAAVPLNVGENGWRAKRNYDIITKTKKTPEFIFRVAHP